MNNPWDVSRDELYKTLITPTYTIAEASQLVRVSRWRISRWMRGYEYTYFVGKEKRDGKQESVIRQSDTPYVSFLDLIDLFFVKRFLDQGFTLQILRKALDEARKLLGTPHFARSKFFTSGNQIILELESKDNSNEGKCLIALMKSGQTVLPQVVEQLYDKVEFEDVTGYQFVNKWYPSGKQGLIVIDPQIAFGRPTLIGRGVAIENIYDLYMGENKKIEPVSHWFNIPRREINAAITFQNNLLGA
jgi:uncharacterized protein (DUF433 family)/DNA-binding transcriptional MerR regulator